MALRARSEDPPQDAHLGGLEDDGNDAGVDRALQGPEEGALETIAVKTVDGQGSSLGAYANKVRLVVNVASKCGLTPQYEAREAVHRKYNDRGFTPGRPSEILWNFEKFLVDRSGQVVERFSPDVAPDDPIVIAAIEKALAATAS